MSPFEISGIAMPDKESKKMTYYNFDKLENLKDGDILLKLHGVDLPDLPAYAKLLKQLNPGDNAELVYQRDGKRYTVDVVIRER